MARIKVLAIAPYEGMQTLLQEEARSFPEIDLTISVGDLKAGVEMARSNFQSNFDIIVSRGGTAKLLGEAIDVPVVEIDISSYDILRILKLAGAQTGRTAVVGFANITRKVEALRDLLPYQVDVFSIDSSDQAVQLLRELPETGYTALLCDMVAYTTAVEMGLNTFLIASGSESIRTALRKVVFCFHTNRQLHTENQFFRQLLQGRDSNTVVFSQDGKLAYSTLEQTNTEVLDVLWSKVPELPDEERSRLMLQHHGLLYNIQAQRVRLDDGSYVAFHFTTSTPPYVGSRCSIRYDDRARVEDEYYHGTYSIVELSTSMRRLIEQAAAEAGPVLITGEVGTGKGHVARMLYLHGKLSHHPFVEVDLQTINSKTWAYLMDHYNSPLCDAENTLFIKNLDALSLTQQQDLAAFLTTGGVTKRNRVILTATDAPEGEANPVAALFLNRLECLHLSLPPLRRQPQLIARLVHLYLNRLNVDMGRQLLGIDRDAMTMLRSFSWPQNYLQFRRVLERVAVMSQSQHIPSPVVSEALRQEVLMADLLERSDTAVSLDISRPLTEINREVARLVLDANDGNNTRTAQSLGISRSTLWRMLKPEGAK